MGEIDEIKERIDVVELIGESVKLRKSGKNYVGFCPFHPNTRTPAFVVFPESGTWRCFGACNEGGDAFRFVMKREGLDFPEALRKLAARAGVELRPAPGAGEPREEEFQRLRELLDAAVTFYRHMLGQAPDGAPARAYLERRGFGEAVLEAFEVGYAPPGRDALLRFLQGKGYRPEEAVQAGAAIERESGERVDRFRNRIVLPIRDGRGRMAGFGARAMAADDQPKYLNSPQTPLFDKGRLLYGLDKARKAIRLAEQAVVVEGYLDVLGLHQAGFENAVSPMGTALTEAQLRLIKRYARRIVLALDADAAGGRAILRGLEVARQSLDRQGEPVFDSRGLVRLEGRLDADLRVLTLPPGKDPDEVVAEDPSAWPAMLGRAQPVVDYVLDGLTAGQDLEQAKVRADIARQVLPLIEDILDPVERETYRQRLARRLKVDERALLSARPAAPAKRGRPTATEAPAKSPGLPTTESRGERFCLGVLLRDPEVLYRMDRQFQALDLDRLGPDDFTGTDRQVIFQAVRASLAQDEEDPVRRWRRDLPEPLLGAAENLQTEAGEFGLDHPRAEEEILASFLRLRVRSVASTLTVLGFQLQAAQEQELEEETGREAVWQLTREVQRLMPLKHRLERALGGRAPIGRAFPAGEGR
ncbi:MAG TPA: DNA primase [Anaerolineales bacterium]